MLNFNFSKKGVGLVCPPHFLYNFSRKMFLMLDSMNLERRLPDVTENLYDVLSTCRSQIPIFLGSSSWTYMDVLTFE